MGELRCVDGSLLGVAAIPCLDQAGLPYEVTLRLMRDRQPFAIVGQRCGHQLAALAAQVQAAREDPDLACLWPDPDDGFPVPADAGGGAEGIRAPSVQLVRLAGNTPLDSADGFADLAVDPSAASQYGAQHAPTQHAPTQHAPTQHAPTQHAPTQRGGDQKRGSDESGVIQHPGPRSTGAHYSPGALPGLAGFQPGEREYFTIRSRDRGDLPGSGEVRCLLRSSAHWHSDARTPGSNSPGCWKLSRRAVLEAWGDCGTGVRAVLTSSELVTFLDNVLSEPDGTALAGTPAAAPAAGDLPGRLGWSARRQRGRVPDGSARSRLPAPF